jgi:hypothetical protein
VQVRRAVAGLVATGLVLAVAGCSSAGGTVTGSGIIPATESSPLPERVLVQRPGLIDTDISAVEVPMWQGPDPSEFLAPNPPSGESGVITGERAGVVHLASLDNPRALWNVGGTVQWLVVEVPA